jgi:hypothetical protein
MSMTKGTPASSQIIWLEGRVKELEQQLERNRSILAGARNCILKYVPSSIESDRDFTLSTIKLALERKES